MIATIKLTIDLEPGEELIPEAAAVQKLQNQLAGAARMSVDELAAIWREAVQELNQQHKTRRQHHRHGRSGG